ncbi:vegetative incompatibility het-e-1 [Trichoderma arundinaceum]|uniref:Vegetative incompatibility het-e-1 n=1 Tax=Trichoderma arundinaceum TaxID=490622 RepID=A0A395NA52_TRIAR|nr:vegetative incompatibility het-e-1 [Trichoderma arundinaceum]
MEQNNYDISELMRRLMGWCEDKGDKSPVKIKMIFSSRIIPILDSQFSAREKIVLHVHTKRDMFRSALSHFKSHPEAIPDDYIELSKMICSQAHGVFLWARFVVKDTLEAYTDGVDPGTFRDRIEKTPVDVFDLFAKILQRVKETDREASATILRLAAFQPSGFRLNTLACAWLVDLGGVDFPFHAPAKLYSAEETEKLHRGPFNDWLL